MSEDGAVKTCQLSPFNHSRSSLPSSLSCHNQSAFKAKRQCSKAKQILVEETRRAQGDITNSPSRMITQDTHASVSQHSRKRHQSSFRRRES